MEISVTVWPSSMWRLEDINLTSLPYLIYVLYILVANRGHDIGTVYQEVVHSAAATLIGRMAECPMKSVSYDSAWWLVGVVVPSHVTARLLLI